jgi:hypothetical protein
MSDYTFRTSDGNFVDHHAIDHSGIPGSGFFAPGTGLNSAVGKGVVVPPTAAGTDAFVHGGFSKADGKNAFAMGEACYAYDGYAHVSGAFNQAGAGPAPTGYWGAFIHGGNNKSYGWYPVVFGQNNDSYYSSYGVTFGTGNQTDATYYSFICGAGLVTNNADSSALFGINNKSYDSYNFVGGLANNVNEQHSVVWGDTNTHASRHGLVVGRLNQTDANADYSTLLGINNDAYTTFSFAHGSGNTLDNYRFGGAFGYSNEVYAKYGFAFGKQNTTRGYYSFTMGSGCYTAAPAWGGLAFGLNAYSTRRKQVAWGSEAGINGQFSHIVQFGQTIQDAQTTILTFTLDEEVTYIIRCLVVANRETTPGGHASFILTRATAYRASGGSATLLGSPPLNFTREDDGAAGANVLVDLAASGNNLLLRVTGELNAHWKYTAFFEFAEVKASGTAAVPGGGAGGGY